MVDWATTFFTKLYKWTMNRFPLANHIKLKSSSNRTKCPLWLVGGDRNASFLKEYSFGNAGLRTRKENYHHPRFLLMGADLATEILVKRELSIIEINLMLNILLNFFVFFFS